MKNKIVIILASFFLPFTLKAQQTMSSEPEMADAFRSNGKIYVVISVLTIAFTCIVAYLIYIDVKLRRLENKK
jgi:Na+/alanine symporter